MVISDAFKAILEDINQKLDILIEGHNGLNQRFDQLDQKIDREIEDRQAADAVLLKEIRELREDLNEHRNNTELHGERKQRKTSWPKGARCFPDFSVTFLHLLRLTRRKQINPYNLFDFTANFMI